MPSPKSPAPTTRSSPAIQVAVRSPGPRTHDTPKPHPGAYPGAHPEPSGEPTGEPSGELGGEPTQEPTPEPTGELGESPLGNPPRNPPGSPVGSSPESLPGSPPRSPVGSPPKSPPGRTPFRAESGNVAQDHRVRLRICTESMRLSSIIGSGRANERHDRAGMLSIWLNSRVL